MTTSTASSPNPIRRSIREAVQALITRAVPREYVRAKTLARVEVDRARYIAFVQGLIDRARGSAQFADRFSNLIHGEGILPWRSMSEFASAVVAEVETGRSAILPAVRHSPRGWRFSLQVEFQLLQPSLSINERRAISIPPKQEKSGVEFGLVIPADTDAFVIVHERCRNSVEMMPLRKTQKQLEILEASHILAEVSAPLQYLPAKNTRLYPDRVALIERSSAIEQGAADEVGRFNDEWLAGPRDS